nr:TolC family protein [uncultured Sulfurimonas sp.]
MVKTFFIIFFLLAFNLLASDKTLIRLNKQDIINEQKKEIEANAQKLKYDWIAPLNLSSSYTKSDTNSNAISDTSIKLNQDIFRSGGIIYKIDYANVKLKNALDSLALANTSMYQELFTGLLEYKKLHSMLKQNHFTLLNTEIDVFLKTQQYETGDADITELNRALREKNAALKLKLTAKQTLIEKEIALKKLTDIELDSIDVPKFELISQDEYKQTNYNLLVASTNKELSDKEYKITKSSYMPTLSVNGAYGYMDNPNINFNDDYYTIGATLSIPLDFNTKVTLQESKAIYMQNSLKIQESKIDEMANYKASVSKIETYKQHKKVIQDNIELYAKLIDITEKAVKSGLKTGYDLQTLQNTKKIDELELEISDINIQIELAKLIFTTKKGENYYE